MKISLSWLNEYVDVQEFMSAPEKLARLLTDAGLEVEGYQNPAKSLANVVVGHIIELGKHPNADKLTLCQVDVGGAAPLQIVCGAKNHKQGDKVIVALSGAVLPGDFAIKKSKIRDVESNGMLCSESELGFKKESEGIVILPTSAKAGTPYVDYAQLNDVIFEINVTPNRADCLSHVGLAREISCLLDRAIRKPDSTVKSGAKKTADHMAVQLSNADMCPRYSGRSIFGVRVGPSPDWLSRRLESVGINSINNIVDVTNFVMMEYGQPLHAFDAKEIRGGKITIENAKPNEKFKSFDGTELELTGTELTIRDGERAVALAGIVGGLNSGVTEKTTELFLESAHFNPRGVRRTSRLHGVDTDSSQRFSRGSDPENVVEAMNRAVSLILQVAGGEAAKDWYDLYPKPHVRKPIQVRRRILTERLGYSVDMADFAKWMKRLHCQCEVDGEVATVSAPPFRFDLEIEMDLVEEYARLNGYDKIPEAFPVLKQRPTESALSFTQESVVAPLMCEQGFYEAKNYSFVSAKWQAKIYHEKSFAAFGVGAGGSPVDIKNPLSEETGQMRQSLLPGLLTNLLHNYHHGTQTGRLFEVGYVFGRNQDGNAQQRFVESYRLAAVAWGVHEGLWEKSHSPVVYEIKSALEAIVGRLHGQVQWRKVDEALVPPFLHPGQAAGVFYEGRLIGFIGSLHPALRDENKLRHEAAVFEVDLSALMRGQPRLPKMQKISKFPSVQRDLALVMPLTLLVGDVQAEIKKAGAPLIQAVEVFDVFRGQGVPDGHQSVAFRMIFQDPEATLSETALTQVLEKIVGAVEKKFGVKPRG